MKLARSALKSRMRQSNNHFRFKWFVMKPSNVPKVHLLHCNGSRYYLLDTVGWTQSVFSSFQFYWSVHSKPNLIIHWMRQFSSKLFFKLIHCLSCFIVKKTAFTFVLRNSICNEIKRHGSTVDDKLLIQIFRRAIKNRMKSNDMTMFTRHFNGFIIFIKQNLSEMKNHALETTHTQKKG